MVHCPPEAVKQASSSPMNLMRCTIVNDRGARTGRGRVFDGEKFTGQRFAYRLPNEWALVP